MTRKRGPESGIGFTSKGIDANKFWARVDRSGDCWIWLGPKNKRTGRAVTNVPWQRAPVGASRVAWVITNGSVADGYSVCHHCDNPICVRPDHLFVGTHMDNMRDMDMKGRGRRTGPHGLTGLTKTHCVNGHEYAVVGFQIHEKDGYKFRRCTQCSRESARRGYHRRQTAAKC